MAESCGDPDNYKALRKPYTTLFEWPDPDFQAGRAWGWTVALGMALGELAFSIFGGGGLSAALASTGIGGPAAAAVATASVAAAAHAAGVIWVVIKKEWDDHLIWNVVTGNNPDGGGGGDDESQAPGEWGPRQGTGGAEYERQVREHHGGPPDKNLYYPDRNGPAYDAWNPDTQSFVDAKDSPGNWCTDDLSPSMIPRRDAQVLAQARRQVEHAGQYGVEWWTNSDKAEQFFKRFFQKHGISIKVVKWP